MTDEERPGGCAQGMGVATTLLCMGLAAGLWMVFVASGKLHEMEVGALCVAATVAFTGYVVGTAGMRFKLRLRDFIEGWRIPWYVAADAVVVVGVLLRDLLHVESARNLYRVCGFNTSKRDPVRIARTVLAVAYTTCSPNSIVIGIDEAQSRMLFHQLKRSGIPKMAKALGAKG